MSSKLVVACGLQSRARMITRGGTLLVVLCACGGREIADIPPPPSTLDGSSTTDARSFADASPTIDASADDATGDVPAVDADAFGAWCAANAPLATFCDDFDAPNRPRLEWAISGTGLDVVTTTSTSAPHALHAKTSSPSYLAFTATSAPYGMKLTADVRLDADGTSGDTTVLLGIESEHGQTIDFAIVPGTNKARFEYAGYDAGPSYQEFTLPRDGAWHTVIMKISFNSDGTLNFLNMVDTQSFGLSNLAGSQNLGNVTMIVGARGTTSSAVVAYFDDVVIES
jgi:hypothetical protein